MHRSALNTISQPIRFSIHRSLIPGIDPRHHSILDTGEKAGGCSIDKKYEYLVLIPVFILIFSFLSLFRNALIDDAFITLNYVRSIQQGYGWSLIPGHISNTATAPLYVILLSALSYMPGVSPISPVVFAALCYTISFHALTRISVSLFSKRIYGIIGFSALLANPLVISTLGMESILFGTLLILSVLKLIKGQWSRMAVYLAMLSLTRFDGVLFFLIFLLFVPSIKERVKSLLLWSGCILPWFIFSWVYFGTFIPDTFFIKTIQNTWGPWSFSNGIILYLNRFPKETILSLLFLPTLITLIHRDVIKMKPVQVLLISGLLHFLGYSLLDVPPYHWYYVPEIVTLVLIGSIGLGVVFSQSKSFFPGSVVTGLALCLPVLGLLFWLAGMNFAVKEMPIHTNRATMEQYKEISLSIKDTCQGKSVALAGEIGTLAYFSECNLLDWFSDRSWLEMVVSNQTRGKGFLAVLYRFNFHFYQRSAGFPPAAYAINSYIDKGAAGKDPGITWKTSTRWTPDSLMVFSRIN